ncbi:MAG: hypothetical protein EBS07_04395, partial [Sphingobacteriia bacterium]|nr:hypothetical protein [Sphingobacteriia bacterium]
MPIFAQSPTGFNVATGVGQTVLFWDAYPSAVGYRIYWSTSPNPYPSGTIINTGSQNISYVHAGLTAGTTYYYQVCALVNPGPAESTPTSQLSAVVLSGNYFSGGNGDGHATAGNCPSNLVGTIYPIQATGLTAAALPGQVSLYWNEVSGATSYTVERSTTSGSGFTTLTSGSLNPTAVDASPVAGTTYYYRVIVNLAGGCSGVVSAEVSATPTAQNLYAGGNGDGHALIGNCPSKLMGTIYPIQATGLIAAALPGQVSLYWNEVAGATGYTVERSTTSGSGFTTLTSGSLNPTA